MRAKRITTIMAAATAVILPVVALAACGGDNDESAAAATPTATRPAATRTVAAPTAAPTDTPAPEAPPVEPSPTTAAQQPSAPQAPPTQAPVQPVATSTPVPPPPPPPSTQNVTIVGKNNQFSGGGMVKVGSPVVITFDNQDAEVTHDLVLYAPGGAEVARTDLITGPAKATASFTPAAAGSYAFKCSVHPREMFGTLAVQ